MTTRTLVHAVLAATLLALGLPSGSTAGSTATYAVRDAQNEKVCSLRGDAKPRAETGGCASIVALAAEARGVASDLFRSVNERRYGHTCELLVTTTRRDLCVAGLRTTFMWWHEIVFRITGVTLAGGRATVHALADGVPGRVVLVRRTDRWRVLRLEGP